MQNYKKTKQKTLLLLKCLKFVLSIRKKSFKSIFRKIIVNTLILSAKKVIISKSSSLSTKTTFKQVIISDFIFSTKSIKPVFIDSKSKSSNLTSIQLFAVVISQVEIVKNDYLLFLLKIDFVSNIIINNKEAREIF